MANPRRIQVRDRAQNQCEYCHLPQPCTSLPHGIDHIRARKHRGPTTLQNICWCCAYCNSAKGSNAAGFDPVTDQLVPLFNPRTDQWDEHFMWRRTVLVGKTPIARATIEVLRINSTDRIEHRRLLITSGQFSVG